MKYIKMFIAMQCLVSISAFAYEDFIKNVDKCNWIVPEQKELYKISPPFDKYANNFSEQVQKVIQQKDEINLDEAKLKAISFYKKYLVKMPTLLRIADKVIQNGVYSYNENASDSHMRVILGEKESWSEKVRDMVFRNNYEEMDNEEYVGHEVDNILSGKYYKNELTDEIKNKYMNPTDITTNFGIVVHYNNKPELLLHIIHETAHVLDLAYRITEDIRSETIFTNRESVSIFFETLARKEFGIELVNTERLCEVYRDMIQHDYLRRLSNDEKEADIDKTVSVVRDAWSSGIDDLINWIDLDKQETYTALDKISRNEYFVTDKNDAYLHHIARALEIISSEKVDVASVLHDMVTIPTPPLSSSAYRRILNLTNKIA